MNHLWKYSVFHDEAKLSLEREQNISTEYLFIYPYRISILFTFTEYLFKNTKTRFGWRSTAQKPFPTLCSAEAWLPHPALGEGSAVLSLQELCWIQFLTQKLNSVPLTRPRVPALPAPRGSSESSPELQQDVNPHTPTGWNNWVKDLFILYDWSFKIQPFYKPDWGLKPKGRFQTFIIPPFPFVFLQHERGYCTPTGI